MVIVAAVVCALVLVWAVRDRRGAVRAVPVTAGVSRALAGDRARRIQGVHYELTLSVPERRQDPVKGRETLRFDLADTSAPVAIDFAPAGPAVTIMSQGRTVHAERTAGHLVVQRQDLVRGVNELTIEFTAGDRPLNRNDDYLYSLFVPARASETFPCFDQPDLKASLGLTLELPAGWTAVANSYELGRTSRGERTTMVFAPTRPLPTYLFGFAAGKFAIEQAVRGGRTLRLYHRETDADRVARNREALFDLHEHAVEWLEDYTARPYPFEKLDFVALPAFQFSGMEHPGAIFYNASSLFLEESATQEQELARAGTIAHETAHMWFGDLVTMKWFDDVWLKEVFANFMAAKIVNPSFPGIDHELRFFLQHYDSAYDVDRTPGANPIRQPLDNLSEAGSLYGPIIYDKAPIVMRQLEQLLGPDELRDGLRLYLARYAFGNATWLDLIDILDPRTTVALAAWSRAWVDEPGRPTISTELAVDTGRIASLAFVQSDPRRGRALLWPQRLENALAYTNGTRISPVRMDAARVEVPAARGLPAPLYVMPNAEGLGYGLFRLDGASTAYLLEHLPEIGDPITRATAWTTLRDDMLEGRTAPPQIVTLALRALPLESNEQNAQRILSYLTEAYWRFLPDDARAAVAPQVERVCLEGMRGARTRSLKAAYFAAFRRTALTASAVARLERIWRRQEAIPDLPLAEPDEIAMAQELALRGGSATRAILEDERARIENPDRKARFEFVMPALSPDEAERDRFFAGLAAVENRRHEPWVVDALSFLNHPLRARRAEKYIRPSLDLLVEIQRTGDIFFPTRWMAAVLDGHASPEAAHLVTDFLREHPAYPPRLRQIVDQTSDRLMRASRMLSR